MVKIAHVMALGMAGGALGAVPTGPTSDPVASVQRPHIDPETIIGMPKDMFVAPEHQRRDGDLDPRCLIADPLRNPCIPGNFPSTTEPTPVVPVAKRSEGERMIFPGPGPMHTPGHGPPGHGPGDFGPGFGSPGRAPVAEKREEEERVVPSPPVQTPGYGRPGFGRPGFGRPGPGPGFPGPGRPSPTPITAEKREEEERKVPAPIQTPGFGPGGPRPRPGFGFPGPIPISKSQQRERRNKRCLAIPGPFNPCDTNRDDIADPVEPENQRRGDKLDARCRVADPRSNPCIPGNYHVDE